MTQLTDQDLYLFNEGSHVRLYEKMGAHPCVVDGVPGTYFAVWAPNAERVSIKGNFNGWNGASHPMQPKASSGIWERFVPHIGPGESYKFHVASRYNNYAVDKADPFAFHAEIPPRTASVVWDLDYTWTDSEWIANRPARQTLHAPMSTYEVH